MSPADNTASTTATHKLRVSVIHKGKGPARCFWRGGVYVTAEEQDVEVTDEEAGLLRADTLVRVRALPASANVTVTSEKAKAALREAGRQRLVDLPPDGADRVQLITWAINTIDPSAEGAWTTDGRPQVDEVNAALEKVETLPEERITARERDAVWGAMGHEQAGAGE
jgi:hypothetical protein